MSDKGFQIIGRIAFGCYGLMGAAIGIAMFAYLVSETHTLSQAAFYMLGGSMCVVGGALAICDSLRSAKL